MSVMTTSLPVYWQSVARYVRAFPYLPDSPDAQVGNAKYDADGDGGPHLNIVMGKPKRGSEFVHAGVIGFCKVGIQAQRTPLEPAPWPRVEIEVNKAVGGWHMHYPGVEHSETLRREHGMAK